MSKRDQAVRPGERLREYIELWVPFFIDASEIEGVQSSRRDEALKQVMTEKSAAVVLPLLNIVVYGTENIMDN